MRRIRLRPISRAASVLSYGGSLATVIMTGLGFTMDLISVPARFALLATAVVAAVVGLVGTQMVRARQAAAEDRARDLARQLEHAQKNMDTLGPELTLSDIARVLFRGPSAWRLTLYVVEGSKEGMHLRRMMRRSGSQQYEASGRDRIPLQQSMLREIMLYDLTNPLSPYTNQSAALPSRESDPEEWDRHQLGILRDAETVAQLSMPTRKYVWCAARDGESGRTVALMAESIDPDGINYELLGSPLISSYILTAARLKELPAAVRPTMTEAATLLAER